MHVYERYHAIRRLQYDYTTPPSLTTRQQRLLLGAPFPPEMIVPRLPSSTDPVEHQQCRCKEGPTVGQNELVSA